MKIALTVWDEEISPVFDSSQKLLIADIGEDQIDNRQYRFFNAENPYQLVEQLEQRKVSVMICGAISELPCKVFETSQVKIIPFISGNVEKILNVITKGGSILPEYRMPGCKGMGCQEQKMFQKFKRCRKPPY
jgi:predicted Fe-Mo cluster-binding NifX family protein